jgi:hypothetical protein
MRGFDSIPNLPRGRIIEIEFRGGRRWLLVCSCVLGFCSWRFLGSSSVPCCGGLQARQGRRVLGRGQGAKGPEAALGRHGLQRGGEARCREVQGGAQEAGAQAARAQHRRRLCSKDALE